MANIHSKINISKNNANKDILAKEYIWFIIRYLEETTEYQRAYYTFENSFF